MKKTLCIFLSILMVLSGTVFAVPVLDTVESVDDVPSALAKETLSASLQAVTTVEPGINFLTGSSTDSWTFEGDYESTSNFSAADGKGTLSIVANPLTSDPVNSSSKVLKHTVDLTGASMYYGVWLPLPKAISARPFYLKLKYYKEYVEGTSGAIKNDTGAFWVMKNDAGETTVTLNCKASVGAWQSYEGVGNFAAKDRDVTKALLWNVIGAGNDGTINFYYDDLYAAPYYEIKFMSNDGNDTVVDTRYTLYVDDDPSKGLVTNYTIPNDIAEPEDRYRYNFIGWSTNPDATEPMTSVNINGEDVVLYAVWDVDETLPEASTLNWDFETAETQTWKLANVTDDYTYEYKNGYLSVTLGEDTDTSGMFTSPKVSADDVVNTKALRYLVVKARSKDTISKIDFSFKTSEQNWSDKAVASIRLNTNSDKFEEYYFDMSALDTWKGDFASFRMKVAEGTGTVDIEEIYLTTLYEPTTVVTLKEVYDMSTVSNQLWGHTALIKTGDTFKVVHGPNNYKVNADGTVKYFLNGTEVPEGTEGAAPQVINEGGFTLKAWNSKGLACADYPYLVFKLKPESTITGFSTWFMATGTGGDWVNLSTDVYTEADGYKYAVFDLASKEKYTGVLTNLMHSTSSGVGYIEEIYLTNKFEVEGYIPGWFFEGETETGVRAWGGLDVVINDGCLIATRDLAVTDSGKFDFVPAKPVSAEDYQYVVIKVKNPADNLQFQSYFVTGTMGGIVGDGYVYSTEVQKDSEYGYYLLDFSVKEAYANGNVNKLVIVFGVPGTHNIEEIYFSETDDIFGAKGAELVKAFINGPSTIDEDNETITLSVYGLYDDGTETNAIKNVKYVTDSVNGQLKVNSDGTATITGQINGDVTVTVYLPNDTTISKKITISNQLDRIATNSFTVAMLGNSIRAHSPAPSIGWFGEGQGMAASSKDKDYAHRFIHYMNEKYGEGTAVLAEKVTTLGTIERNIAGASKYVDDINDLDYSQYFGGIYDAISKANPDIITLQMGENVGEATLNEYTIATSQFVDVLRSAAPDALIILCTPFWGGANKIAGMQATAAIKGLPVANLHVLNTTENMAYGSMWDVPEYSSVNGGVLRHPGDLGMDNIAKLLFEQANLYFSQNDDTVYTTVPKSVEFTSTVNTITEEYGKLQLSARVLPETASQDLIWTVDNNDIGTVDENGLVSAINDGTLTVTAKSKYVDSVYATYQINISNQSQPFTLTYDANTTDEVTNLPAPNTLAKEGFVLSTNYPVRPTYRFLGWSLEQDGTTFVDALDVTEDTTVYAIWEKAYRWTFDRDGYKEDVTVSAGFNEVVLDGVYMAIATGTTEDLRLTYHTPEISINPEDYDAFYILMQNTEIAKDTQIDLTFTTTKGTYTRSYPVTTTTPTYYQFTLDGIEGTITKVSFMPTNMDCTINLDEMAFAASPDITYDANTTDSTVANMPAGVYNLKENEIELTAVVPTRQGYTFLGWVRTPESKLLLEAGKVSVEKGDVLYAVWDKNDHWEMNSGETVASSEMTEYKNGIVSFTEGTGSADSYLFFHPGIDASVTSKKLVTRFKHSFEKPQTPQVFLLTDWHPDLIASTDPSILVYTGKEPSSGTADEFYTFEFADMTKWQHFRGIINSFRWDMSGTVGTMSIDYLRFTDSQPNIVADTKYPAYVYADDPAATYIVKEGSSIIPDGHIEIGNLALRGDVDYTNGYLLVKGTVEIADDAEYAVYTLNEVKDGYDMYISGYDYPVSMVKGGKYIVKTANGVGLAYFVNPDDVSDVVSYKVTKNGATALNNHLITSSNDVTMRTSEPLGIRVCSNILNSYFAENSEFEITEVGYIIGLETVIGDGSNLNMDAVESGNAITDVSYDETKNIVYNKDSQNTTYSCVFFGMPDTKKAYTENIMLRTYAVIGGEYKVYGNVMEVIAYEAAKELIDTVTVGSDAYNYLNNIITVSEK